MRSCDTSDGEKKEDPSQWTLQYSNNLSVQNLFSRKRTFFFFCAGWFHSS